MKNITESITNRSKLSIDDLSEPVVKSCIYIDNGVDIGIEIKNNTILINNNHSKVCDLRIEVEKWEELELPKNISFEKGKVNVIFSNHMKGWNIKGTKDSTIYLLRNQGIQKCTFDGRDMPIHISDGKDWWEPTEDPNYLSEGEFDFITISSTGRMIDELFSNTIHPGSITFKVNIYVEEEFMVENSIQDVLNIFDEYINKYSKLYAKYSKYIDLEVDY